MQPQFIDIPQPKYEHYIRYNNYQNEFEKVARNNKIKVIYNWQGEAGNSWMGFLHGGLFHLYEIPNMFTDINECEKAFSEGFTDCSCKQYRQLRKLGYSSQEEVDEVRGDYGYDQWIEIKSNGFDSSSAFDEEKGTEISDEVSEVNDPTGGNPELLDVETFQFNTAIIDGNNIAWGDYEDYPKFKFLKSTYNQLRDLGVKPYVVVSAALRHRIDQPIELVEFLKQDDVAEAPAERPDDFFVIQLAFKREAFIVSNDRFKDWKKANPDLADEIENRRVALTFIEEEPQFDHKLYKLIKRPTKYW